MHIEPKPDSHRIIIFDEARRGSKLPVEPVADFEVEVPEEWLLGLKIAVAEPGQIEQHVAGIKSVRTETVADLNGERVEKGKGDVDVLDEYGNTLLHLVALADGQAPKVALARLLIDRGLVVNYPRKEGLTALSCAASMGPPELVRLLLEHGADVNAVEANGDMPIHRAAYEGKPETVELLIEHGADVNAAGEGGKSPLDNAGHTSAGRDVESILKRHGAR